MSTSLSGWRRRRSYELIRITHWTPEQLEAQPGHLLDVLRQLDWLHRSIDESGE